MVVLLVEVISETKIKCLNFLVLLSDCRIAGGRSLAMKTSINAQSFDQFGDRHGRGPDSCESVEERSCRVEVIQLGVASVDQQK